jgi:hypothetical protein
MVQFRVSLLAFYPTFKTEKCKHTATLLNHLRRVPTAQLFLSSFADPDPDFFGQSRVLIQVHCEKMTICRWNKLQMRHCYVNYFLGLDEVVISSKRSRQTSWDNTTEYTELQLLLSGVHSVMRVKLALAGEGGGCTPTPSHYIYHHQ